MVVKPKTHSKENPEVDKGEIELPAPTKWTVMVFMGAATIGGDDPLTEAAALDLQEMESVKLEEMAEGKYEDEDYVKSRPLNIFAQVHHSAEKAQRTHIGVKALHPVPENERDPARGQALEYFIRWAIEHSGHKAEDKTHHTMLVLWGHAYDFALGRTPTRTGIIDALDFAELSRVLERLQERYGAEAKLDILGFDACDLSTVEMACQLQPFASYLLGSEIGIPIPGWPYDRILDRLQFPMNRLMGPAELGAYVVRRYCESYTAERPVSLSLLHLDRAPELFAHAEVLAQMLASAIEEDDDVLEQVAELFIRSQTASSRPYIDVADFCLNLVRECGDPLVVEAARSLGDFLISPPPLMVGRSAVGDRRPFILEHGRNAGQTARLNGISLYAPHVALENDFASVRHLYENFIFAQETRWSELVHVLARLSQASLET